MTMTNQRFKDLDQEQEDDGFDVGFQLPDTQSLLQRLESAEKNELRREHREAMEEEEKQGKPKKRQRRGGTVCMCEDPNCRIGPFLEKQ